MGDGGQGSRGAGEQGSRGAGGQGSRGAGEQGIIDNYNYFATPATPGRKEMGDKP